MDAVFDKFRRLLWRGGAYGNYFLLPAQRAAWFEAIDDAPDVTRAVANGQNVYFGVHPLATLPPPPFERRRSRNEWIAATNCVYAEFDGAAVARLAGAPLRPSVVIASGGGVHAYWLFDEPYLLSGAPQRAVAAYVQRAWTALVGADEASSDLARMLRVPGTLNWKYNPPRPVEWIECRLDVRYPYEMIVHELPTPERRKPAPTPAPAPRTAPARPVTLPIQAYNDRHRIGAMLEQRGYVWRARCRMLSPYSRSGQPGVYVDDERNRAFVHHGSDPLGDGYWKRPFDVLLVLDCGGDFARALGIARAEMAGG